MNEVDKKVIKESLTPVATDIVTRPTQRYRVVLEQLTEEIIEIEAESELDAIDLAILGGGELVDGITFSPAVVASGVIDD